MSEVEGSAVTPAAGLPKVLRTFGPVLANTTLVTALLFYFGFLYTQVFFAHFRVHYTTLQQPLQEILPRAADGLFMPVALLASVSLIALCTVRLVRLRLPESAWERVLHVCTPVAAVTGGALVVTAVVIAVNPDPFRRYAGLPGLGLAIGILLLTFAWRRVLVAEHAGGLVIEWVLTFVLVSIGLFWAVGDYSGAVGQRRAVEVEARIPQMPDAVVYSERSLNLTGAGIVETDCGEGDGAFAHRYEGLKLLLASGGQYVLLPARWHSADGVSVVIPQSSTVRLEFSPSGSRPATTC